jgi:hypothetical protein
MAEFFKRQNRFTHDDNGLELAYVTTFSAKSAFVHIHLGNRGGNGFRQIKNRMDKKMGVGFFDITIQQLNRRSERHSQIGCHGRFAGATLAAGDTDNHYKNSLIRTYRKFEALNKKYETNPKFEYSNVQNI